MSLQVKQVRQVEASLMSTAGSVLDNHTGGLGGIERAKLIGVSKPA